MGDSVRKRPPDAMRGRRMLLYWGIVIMAVAIDQATKAAARKLLDATPRPAIPGVIDLVHAENTGAAFSIGEGATWLFAAIAVACVLATLCAVWRVRDLPMWLVAPISLVAGGAFGNLIDRVMRGSVTDFVATAFIDFPVFNVADVCVTVGTALGIVGYWVWETRRQAEDE